jgi:hypothetical protein
VTIGASLAVARWSPRRQPLALLLVAPALHTLLMTGGWPPRGADGARAKAEASAVAAALREGPGEVVWADYWDAYRLAVLVGGTRRWVPLSVIDRRPDWRPVAERPVPVAYLVRRTDGRLRRETLQRAAAAGIAVSSQREVGRFHHRPPHSRPGIHWPGPRPVVAAAGRAVGRAAVRGDAAGGGRPSPGAASGRRGQAATRYRVIPSPIPIPRARPCSTPRLRRPERV